MAKEKVEGKIKSPSVKIRVEAKRKSSPWPNILMVLGAIVIFYALTSASIVPVTEQELIQKGEAYNVLVPVTKEIPYQERVPFGSQRCAVTGYEFNDSYVIDNRILDMPDGSKKWNMICTVTVENKEDINGSFTYGAVFKKKDIGFIEPSYQTKEIAAKSSVDFVFTMGMDSFGNLVSCAPKRISIPTANLCRLVEPITYSYVTSYKNVTEMKNETRYKDMAVQKTMNKYVNKLFGYEQFFYLGY